MDPSEPRIDESDVLEHADFVRAVASEVCGDAADDVAQDSLLRALEYRPARGSSLRGWFATVVRNRARELRRLDDRRFRRESASARGESLPSAADAHLVDERRRAVTDALARLKEPYRSAVRLRFSEGLPPSEIARRQRISAGTARSRIHRGLALLRSDARLEPFRPRGAQGPPGFLGLLGLLLATLLRGRTRPATARAVLTLGATTVAGAALVWSLRAPDHGSAPALWSPPGRPEAAASPGTGLLVPPTAPTGTQLLAERAPAAAPAGRCIDAGGAPLPGVTVGVFRADVAQPGHVDGEPLFLATTDADGAFALPPIHGDARVWAWSDELAALECLEVRPRETGALELRDVELILGEVLAQRVRVTDTDDRPLPGTEVTLQVGSGLARRRPKLLGVWYSRRLGWRAHADAQGEVRFRAPVGERRLAFAAPGYAPREVRPGGEPETTVRLNSNATLAVRILGPSGAALAGVEVAGFDTRLHDAVATDATGRAVLQRLSSRLPIFVRIAPPEGSPAGSAVRGPFYPARYAGEPQVIELAPSDALVGRAVGRGGAAVPGARLAVAYSRLPEHIEGVEYVATHRAPLYAVRELEADADGRFQVEGLGSDPVGVAALDERGDRCTEWQESRAGAEGFQVNVPVAAAVEVVLRVTDAPGAEGTSVKLLAGTVRVPATAADGAERETGARSFVASVPGGEPIVAIVERPGHELRVLDLGPARDSGRIDTTLDLTGAPRDLAFEVVDASGAPQPSALVFARDADDRALFTQQGGLFLDHAPLSRLARGELCGLPAGDLTLLVRHPQLAAPVRVPAPASEPELRVVLPVTCASAGPPVQVLLRREDGTPIPVRRPALETLGAGTFVLSPRPPADPRTLGRTLYPTARGRQLRGRSEVQLAKVSTAWFPAQRGFRREGLALLRLPREQSLIRVELPGFEPAIFTVPAQRDGSIELEWTLVAEAP